MIRAPAPSALFAFLQLTAASASLADSAASQAPTRPPTVPFVFEENVGRAPASSRFLAHSGSVTAHFEDRAIALQLLGGARGRQQVDVIRLELVGARREASPAGVDPRHGVLHGFYGADPLGWRTGGRTFERLSYRGAWNGIDLWVRDAGGVLEYDLVVAPGARVEDAVFRCDGIRGLRVEDDGRLALTTAGGILHQTVPRSWSVDRSGRRKEVSCRFRRIAADRFGFTAPNLDHGQTLVIDPGLVWSTFLGGKSTDYAWRMAVQDNGDITVAGYTASSTFPTTAGSYGPTYAGRVDAFVTRMSPDGRSLRWSTFVGGSDEDYALGLALSKDGAATITGFTKSRNFPVTPGALQRVNNGGFGECFVTRIDPTGSKLVYSTYLGHTDWDYATGVAVDAAGNATVIGVTKSTGFPTTPGAFDTTHNGGGDGFVTRIDPTGSQLLFSTFLGSSGWDPLNDLALDAQGNVFVVADIFGVNNTSNFPTTPGAYDTTYNDKFDRSDTIVCKLSSDGSKLLWSTWLGGDHWDPCYGIVLDAAGNPTICGESWSSNFPVTGNAWQKTNQGLGDGYVARLSADGSKLLFATLFGGKAGEDRPFAIALDPFDAIVVAGFTSSSDLPTTPGAISSTYQGKFDTFVARFSPDASRLYYSTLLSCINNDHPYALSLTPHGEAILTGDAYSADFPSTPGSYQPGFNGSGDAFLAKLSLLPTGAERFGTSAPACGRATPFGITTQPRENATDFALLCAGAPASTAGLLLVGVGRLNAPVPFVGAELWVDFGKPVIQLGVVSGRDGRITLPVPIPGGLKGLQLFNQFLWANTAGCGGKGSLSSSDGIELLVQ